MFPVRFAFSLFFSFVVLSVFAQHKKVTQLPEPFWVELIQPDINALLPDDQASGFYYLLIDKQENLHTDQSYRRFSYKILNTSGVQDMSDVLIDFDPAYQQVEIHHINIIRDGQILDRSTPDNVQVVPRETNMERKLYDTRLTILVKLNDIQPDDIIDYSYTIKGSNPLYQGKFQAYFPLEFNIDAYQNRISIIVPTDEKFHLKKMHGAKDPEVEETSDFFRYTWESFDLQTTEYENNTPIWYEEIPAIAISQLDSWSEVADLFAETYTLQEKERRRLAMQIRNLFPHSENDREFIENAIRFVQDEIRYLDHENGVPSHIPKEPSEVLQNRFGDANDKSFLLSEILRGRGIKAYPTLVHSYNGRNLTSGLPSPNVFDHCIVQIDLGNKSLKYIDPTMNQQGGDLDNIYFPDFKKGLVLKPETEGLISLPAYRSQRMSITETFELDDIGGGANFIVTTIFRGEAADSRRRHFMEVSLQSIQKDYTSFYSSLYPGIKADEPLSFEDNRKTNEFVTFEKYRIDSIWTRTNMNKDVIQTEFSPLSIEHLFFPERSEDRKMPYFLDQGVDIVYKTVVYVPKAWNVKNERSSLKSDYFNWDLDIRYKNAKLEITHKYKILKDHVASEDLQQFLADHSEIREDLNYYLTYNYKVAGAAEANATSWGAVTFMILLMAWSGFLCYLIYRNYDLPAKVDRKHERKIGGWLILLGIGLLITPFTAIIQLLSGNYFSGSVWISFFSSTDSISMAILLGAELAYYSIFLVFSLLVLVLFLKRRTIAPGMMIILYASSFVFSALLAFVSLTLHPEILGGPEKQDLYLELTKMAIRCAIFIPYLLYSTRVEETFTRTGNKYNKPKENDFPEEVSVAMIR